jgi:type IV secretory pathway VirB10-like protein
MTELPYTPPPIQNRTPKPPGVLPKNYQGLMIGGIALVMVIVIALSGSRTPKERREPSTTAASAVDPNIARIQDYRSRIEQQAQKLALEQARLAEADQTAQRLAATGVGAAGISANHSGLAQPFVGYRPSGTGDRERSWIELDRERREYESRYASNIAASHRKPPGPSWEMGTSLARFDAQASAADPVARATSEASEVRGKTYRLFEGTVIETVLTNRLDGSFSGPVNCMVTTHVYSPDRQKLLIPQGSRVLGSVSRVETFGQQRLAISFHRLIRPDQYSLNLEKLPGLNQVGETGLVDRINRHYGQIFGVSLAIGAIAGLSQANTSHGAGASGTDAYRQGVASSLSQTSLNILDRYLNVLPTFTIREGHRIKVYLTGDLILPEYATHAVPKDLSNGVPRW